VSAPKSTSVPAGTRVAAKGSSDFLRFCMSSGAHWLMTRESSEYSMPSNSGCVRSAS
jgi:hypothetical protein